MVSIIIPIYNVAPYIERCLLSVYNQTYTDLEVLLIDDCGSDNSITIAEKFIFDRQWKEARILVHEKNRGLSAARNTGIKHATGDYVYFLDSDDEITPDCMEVMVKLAVKYQVDLVQGNYKAIPEGWCTVNNLTRKAIPKFIDDRQKLISIILERNAIPMMAWNRLIKRSFILEHKLFFKEGIIHEDDHWNFYAAKYLRSIAISTLPTYIYYKNSGSIMNGEKGRERSYLSWKTIFTDWALNIGGFGKKAEIRMLFSMIYNTYDSIDCKDFELFKCLKPIIRCNWSFMFLKITHRLFKEGKISKSIHLTFVKAVFKMHKVLLGIS